MPFDCVKLPRLLVPRLPIDITRWAVIACDQFTAAPAFWQCTEKIVGDAPSTLRLTLPEVHLSENNARDIARIHRTMHRYLASGKLHQLPEGLMLIERDSGRGIPRRGVLLAFDLEAYDERPGAKTAIRPTEATVSERIPARLAIRAKAPFELPHILLFVDDPAHTLLEPLFAQKQNTPPLYDFNLMQGGGHMIGRFTVPDAHTHAFLSRLSTHAVNRSLVFATGDGNHSMAAAKAHWEGLKTTLSPAQAAVHPARFVLAELVNLHDDSICFEAVHRLLMRVDAADALAFLSWYFGQQGLPCRVLDTANDRSLCVPFYSSARRGVLALHNADHTLAVTLLQPALDAYLAVRPTAAIDYIHGTDQLVALAQQDNHLGFALPDFSKQLLFPYVQEHGVLPRKTFSMGTALEKRYYLEGRRICL